METLHRQIARAQVRLLGQSFIGKLGWSWFATLTAATVAIAAIKLWSVADAAYWSGVSVAVALGVGLVAAAIWTWLARPNALEVAAEIDRRFALKERVSSTLSLSSDQANTEIGQALAHDALRRVERIEVPTQFPLRADRRALLPLLPGAAAFAVAVFVGARVPSVSPAATAAETAQVKKSVESLAKKLDEKRKEAAEAGLKEEDALLAQLVQGARELAEKNQADRKQTLVALNDLAKEAEKRREQLAATADLKQQLNQLKNFQQGPAQKMAGALKNGDLKKAAQEIARLQEKLAGDELQPKEKEELAKQLEQMQQALEKMVHAQKQAEKDLKEQIEKQQQAGNKAEVEKLQKQLDKLAEKNEQMKQLDQMAMQLKAAAEAMRQGQSKQAAQELAKLSDQLSDLQMDLEEMAMLDEAMDQLGDCKNAMACKECQGEGCKECQGDGMKLGDLFRPGDWQKGGGRGAGKRAKRENETGFVDSQVKQNVGKGAMVVKGAADGPNRKGLVQEAIKEEFAGATQEAAEALTDQHLPHDYRDHAKDYFEALREAGR